MFHARTRCLLLAAIIVPAVGGCSSQSPQQQIATGPWVELSSSAAPASAPATGWTTQTAYLGAGDRFGPTLHRQYIASIERVSPAITEAVVSGQPIDE